MDSFSNTNTYYNRVEETASDFAVMKVFGTDKPNQSATAVTANEQIVKVEHYFASEDEIKEKINSANIAHAGRNSFEYSLFIIVQNLLEGSTQIVDEVMQGTQVHKEKKGTPYDANINVPFCELKQIASEIMICKNGVGPRTAHEKTMSILDMLPEYSLEAKAVLTLAAFAMEFGDFWLLAQINQSMDQQVVKSLATLKRVSIFASSSGLLKQRVIIRELKEIIGTILQVVETIFEVQELAKTVHELQVSLQPLPINVVAYWIITTVVACATKVSMLTCGKESDDPQNLAPYLKKIHEVFNMLTERRITLEKIRDDVNHYHSVRKLFEYRADTVKIFKTMFFHKDEKTKFIDTSANYREVDITTELSWQNVLIFVSRIDNIRNDEISSLTQLSEKIKRENHDYKIVWVPIVDQWTDKDRRDFTRLTRTKMQCYVVDYSLSQSYTAGIKYIKEQWNFSGNSILVVMNSQGEIINGDALPILRLGDVGLEAFPFGKEDVERVVQKINWLRSVVNKIDFDYSGIKQWIVEKDSYIFFYGGKDHKWAEDFAWKVKEAAKYLAGKANVTIHLFHIDKSYEESQENSKSRSFWSGVEDLFYDKVFNKKLDSVTKEIQKLYSYTNKDKWFLLSKGPRTLVVGHGFSASKIFEDFDDWKNHVHHKEDLEVIFKKRYEIVVQNVGIPCCRLDIPISIGKMPTEMICADCGHRTIIKMSYQCCHEGTAVDAHKN